MATVADLFLRPGEWYFGEGDLRVSTLLGSCVAFVFWHPLRRCGGMTHSLLPTRHPSLPASALDGHYLDDALLLMLGAIARHGGEAQRYLIHLYGGGSMFPQLPQNGLPSIGMQNVRAAHALLATHGLSCAHTHVKGSGYRRLRLDLRDGSVHMQQAGAPQDAGPSRSPT